MRTSPTALGWRVMYHDPALALGEIAWRWIFGLIVIVVLAFSALVYLDTIVVPPPAIWLMATRQPAAVTTALIHTFRGSSWAATKITLVGLPALGLFWIVIASLGRAATLEPMLANAPGDNATPGTRARAVWPRLLGLSFLRFTAWFVANVAVVGALVLAGITTAGSKRPAGPALLVFFSLTLVVLAAWSFLNWVLALAAIFVVRDYADTFGSISAAVDLLRRRFPELISTSAAWGTFKSLAVIIALLAAVAILSIAANGPPGYVLTGWAVVVLGYCAGADLLYLGRLASYVAIVEADLEPPPPAPPLVPELPPAQDLLPLPPQLPAES